MEAVLSSFSSLVPMFLLIGAGFFAGRWLGLRGEAIAPLLIYLITPAVVFGALLKAPLSLSTILIPSLVYGMSALICGVTFFGTRRFFGSPRINLISFAAGNANSGYFALPVGIALFGEGAMPLIVLASFGFILYENTLGVFVMALGKHAPRAALLRILKLPALYAFAAGLLGQTLGITLSPKSAEFLLMLRHTYSVLGMMLIGLGLSTIRQFRADIPLLLTMLASKHCLWPLIALPLLWAEHHFLGTLTTPERSVLVFMSSLPLAANTVAWATLLSIEPEKASSAVLLSTVLAPLSLAMLPWLLSLLAIG